MAETYKMGEKRKKPAYWLETQREQSLRPDSSAEHAEEFYSLDEKLQKGLKGIDNTKDFF